MQAEKCLVTSASAVGCSSKIRASPRSAHHCRAKPPLMGLQRPTSTDRKAMLEDMMARCSNTGQCHFAGDDLTNLACLFSLRSAIKGAIPFSITVYRMDCELHAPPPRIHRRERLPCPQACPGHWAAAGGKRKAISLGNGPAWLYMTCVVLRTCGVSPRIWHRTECHTRTRLQLCLARAMRVDGLQEQAAPQAHRKHADLRNLQIPGRGLDVQPQEASKGF